MADSPVAIVTGAAQGLGAAISITLLKEGYRLLAADIQEEKGKQFVEQQQKEFGVNNILFSLCDVTKEDDYREIFKKALEKFQRIDVVINNAGIILEQNPRKCIDVNLMGVVTGCQLALEYMGKSNGGKGGVVVNTASIVGFLPYSSLPVYTATKHGVVGLTRSYGLPYHFDKDGIVFSAICPCFVDTNILEDLRSNALVPGYDVYANHEVMEAAYVSQGVLKILKDRINGSTLLITTKGYQYVEFQEIFNTVKLE